jgi:hypothetical protein
MTGVQLVYQLREKILKLIEWAKNNGSELNSMRAIERATGIDRTTLISNMESYRMSQANQKLLAKAYGFEVEWPEWRDPNETKRSGRRDTADAFFARFIAEKASSGPLTIETGPTLKHIDTRFANFRFTVPASFQPEKATDAVPMSVALSFDRRGWSVLLEEGRSILNIGLKQADLQLFHDRTSAKIEVCPLSHGNGMEGNFRGDVEGLSAWWVINVAAGDPLWLAGKRESSDSQDCLCHGFRVGDRIQAVMTARVSDCFVSVKGDLLEDLCEEKVLFIKQLVKLSVLKDAEAVLCEQTLTVVNK